MTCVMTALKKRGGGVRVGAGVFFLLVTGNMKLLPADKNEQRTVFFNSFDTI